MATRSKWQQELEIFSRLNDIVVLSDNIYDEYPIIQDSVVQGYTNLESYLTQAMISENYYGIFGFDPVRGFHGLYLQPSGSVPQQNPESECLNYLEKIIRDAEPAARSSSEGSGRSYVIKKVGEVTYLQPNCIVDAAKIAYYVLAQTAQPTGIVMRFSSRFVGRPDDLEEEERQLLMYLRLGSEAATRKFNTPSGRIKNRLYLLADKLNDLPAWFYLNAPRVKPISIPKPDHRARTDNIEFYSDSFPGMASMEPNEREEAINKFIGMTDGLSTTDMENIRQLMIGREINFANIEKAVQLYRHGVQDNPWEDLGSDFLLEIEGKIKERIIGQDKVVKRAVDVIKRAALGMSGIQQSSNSSRPRGVLFLAGPTGTGKTELAKVIAGQLFKDERNIVRFDMSEYREPQSDQRLLGAPPGYVGYDEGGQLTNAVREKPFSVLLFDEIEKAHPSILDKFLQILDDGRITDSRGDTVYFQDCLIVFTSNLGIMKISEDGKKWVQNVSYNDKLSFSDMESTIIAEIRRYFREVISRPELLNRIGENILVFDYIREDSLEAILRIQTGRIVDSMRKNKHIKLDITPDAFQQLYDYCLKDLPKGEGGRGIGNSVEKYLINPLSRYVFDYGIGEGQEIKITNLVADPERGYSLEAE